MTGAAGAVPGFRPENQLERRVASDPVLAEGLAWGKPRSGHPEGRVGEHLADLLRTLGSWDEPGPRRSELRFMALVHDAFKNQVQHWRPRTGENHHATPRAPLRRALHRRRAAAGHDRVARPPLRDLAPLKEQLERRGLDIGSPRRP